MSIYALSKRFRPRIAEEKAMDNQWLERKLASIDFFCLRQWNDYGITKSHQTNGLPVLVGAVPAPR
jgi:hypothetical protein